MPRGIRKVDPPVLDLNAPKVYLLFGCCQESEYVCRSFLRRVPSSFQGDISQRKDLKANLQCPALSNAAGVLEYFLDPKEKVKQWPKTSKQSPTGNCFTYFWDPSYRLQWQESYSGFSRANREDAGVGILPLPNSALARESALPGVHCSREGKT